jgi:hypothetical protein
MDRISGSLGFGRPACEGVSLVIAEHPSFRPCGILARRLTAETQPIPSQVSSESDSHATASVDEGSRSAPVGRVIQEGFSPALPDMLAPRTTAEILQSILTPVSTESDSHATSPMEMDSSSPTNETGTNDDAEIANVLEAPANREDAMNIAAGMILGRMIRESWSDVINFKKRSGGQ